MPRPPMSKFFSTISTDAPLSRAAIAATRPPAPAPMTTTSASRSQAMASAACAAGASATATTAAPEARKLRRSIAALGRFSRSLLGPASTGDFDIVAPPLDRLATILQFDVFAAAYETCTLTVNHRPARGSLPARTVGLHFNLWLAYRVES